MNSHMIAAAVVAIGAARVAAGAADLMVFTDGSAIRINGPDGRQILQIAPVVWGPNWAWTGVGGSFEPAGGGARAEVNTKLGGTGAPLTFDIAAEAEGKRKLKIDVAFSVGRDTKLTQAVIGIDTGAALNGAGRATVETDAGSKMTDLPFSRGAVSGKADRIVLRGGRGERFALTFDPATAMSSDGQARVTLASGELAAGDVRRVSIVLELPRDAVFALTAEELPVPDDWDQWFEWKGTGHPSGPSAIDMSDWLDAPAGKHGVVTMRGDQLIYNGRPAKFWGANTCFANCAPSKDRADRQSAFYARYGINAVRFHKYADGPGWAGICTDGAAKFDPRKLEAMDYYVAKLKEHGIFIKLSANFGSLPLGPADLAKLSFASELKKGNNGWARAGQGALWFSREVQDLQIAQLVDILKHTNPHTAKRYADDPAVMCVELVNENSIFFYTTLAALQNTPTIKRLAGEAFFAWLKNKYGSERALVEAWGEGTIGAFAGEKMADESWDKGLIYPVGNPWFFDPDQLEGAMAARKQRMLDTMAFFYDQQNAFYDRFVKEIRATGYEGLILSSNWQAGRAYSHYLNLHSDSRVGLIDRHNYFGGAGSMLANPGGGSLSAGMQQVADRPFMLSEWIHVFPNEFGVEGPAIIGAYGMGLNGWDVSYMFQNGDDGSFRRELKERWDVAAPQVMGVFPAVARQVLRGDVKESDLVFRRNVHVPSLKEGKLGFDDRVKQAYDVKEFGSDTVPASTLAIGRSVVSFTDTDKPTESVDLERYIRDGMIHSATGQLAWKPGESARDGYFTIDTAGTQAVVGFASGVRAELADVIIAPGSDFAAVYVSAPGRNDTIADADRLIVTTIARVRNTGMKLVGGDLIARGRAPMLVEPVKVELTLKRGGDATVHILDHDGHRTGRTIDSDRGKVMLDSAATQAVYYEVVYR